jgi:hypothetical protein
MLAEPSLGSIQNLLHVEIPCHIGSRSTDTIVFFEGRNGVRRIKTSTQRFPKVLYSY